MESRDIERRVLLSVLKLTRDGPASSSTLQKESRMPASVLRTLLERLDGEGFLQLQNDRVEASPVQRVRIAVRSLALGGDFEDISRSLGWLEFENIVALAFEENGYAVRRRLRFRSRGRRWEIDILALRRPLLILVECKHWLHGFSASATKKAIEAHLTKTQAFTEALPGLKEEIGLLNWPRATLVPVLVSLTRSPFKFYKGVPIVPVLQLSSFLSDLSAYATHLKHLLVDLHDES